MLRSNKRALFHSTSRIPWGYPRLSKIDIETVMCLIACDKKITRLLKGPKQLPLLYVTLSLDSSVCVQE